MNNGVDKINAFINNVKYNKNSGISKGSQNTQKTEHNESKKKEPVIPNLPEGVSTYNIDGDEITIYKNGDDIQTQIVGKPVKDMNTIYEKVKRYIEEHGSGQTDIAK